MLLTTHTLNNLIVPYGMKFEASGLLGLSIVMTQLKEDFMFVFFPNFLNGNSDFLMLRFLAYNL